METLIGQGAEAQGNWVKDTTDADFPADVLEASMEAPVIVDFWAPWCGPCKQIGPVLEKVVQNAGGKLRMVKINIDEHPMVAQQMRVQSIPAVFGFFQGRPVDGFMGAVPESQVKGFAEKLVKAAGGALGPDPVEAALAQADEVFETGDYPGAAAIYMQILQHDQTCAPAAAGLGMSYVKAGQIEAAQQLVEQLPDEMLKDAKLAGLMAQLELASAAGEATGELDELEARAQDENDLQAHYDLAVAAFAAGAAERAIEALLHIIARDRDWNENAAREQLLKIFEAQGPTDPLTLKGRRGLSSILFS